MSRSTAEQRSRLERQRSRVKPDTRTAMHRLIAQIREVMPFDAPEPQRCADSCNGCSVKLLAYLETEIDSWEARLAEGEQPSFGDLSRLARTGRKIHTVLLRNGLVEPLETEHSPDAIARPQPRN